MRIDGTAISISWIPSEAIRGMNRLPFERGVAHYDEPPPSRVEVADIDALRAADRFRFANVLRAWIDVDDQGRIESWGQDGGGIIGATTLAVSGRTATFEAVPYPDRVAEPVVGATSVRFAQTAGGRTGVPTPRRVNRPPFVQLAAPTAWTTIEVELHADGRRDYRLSGASPFPRHWLYGDEGSLVAKSGTIEFRRWYRGAFGGATPWGDVDHEVRTGEVESELERALSHRVMANGNAIRKVKQGHEIIREGDSGDEMYLLLDGVVAVVVGGDVVAELGPGAVLGERASLEEGVRTATVTALTTCRIAVTSVENLERDDLERLSTEHRREVAVLDQVTMNQDSRS
jgi:hypothetical protein